jgi:selenide,water dikinase
LIISIIILLLGDDAAIMKSPDSSKYLVQTIDYFRSFVSDPFLFGQVAANHALSDVFAMNGEAVSALALCVLPFGTEKKVEDELVHMIAGMKSVLTRENCQLVGGHTSEGQEPALGLAVTGIADPLRIFHKGPIAVSATAFPSSTGSFHLILTKAIETGTILAAHMRNQTKGRWMKGCYESMVQSNSPAATVLSKYDCIACTDVTGFGLLGHLVEMIRYQRESEEDDDEDVNETENNNNNDNDNINKNNEKKNDNKQKERKIVRLFLSQIPVLSGAIECTEKEIVSSLFSQNVRSQQFIRNIFSFENHPVYQLLFDPQTSGGLLAVVPSEQSNRVIQELKETGYPRATVIGEVCRDDNEKNNETKQIEGEEDEENNDLIELQ